MNFGLVEWSWLKKQGILLDFQAQQRNVDTIVFKHVVNSSVHRGQLCLHCAAVPENARHVCYVTSLQSISVHSMDFCYSLDFATNFLLEHKFDMSHKM